MTETAAVEYLVSECPDHGTKSTGDLKSLVHYVGLSLQERRMARMGYVPDLDPGVSPWVCCERMVIDPHDVTAPVCR